ncbi:MAG: HU family DNA-binding protein, partial [Paludibacteraceae bacterium]|nr:HU family DNA-binding protein [Paludibacteraceae bacterium]
MENKKITIQDIVDEVAAKGGFTKKYTEDFLRELVSVIEEYLNRDGLVKVKGLGTFKLLWNEERKSVNVMTQEEIVIPAHYKVSFTPETSVKERINEPYSHLSTMVHGTSDSASQPASEPQPAPVSAPECGYMMPASELRSDLPEPQEEQPAPTATPASDPEPAPSAWSWSRVETPSAPTSEPEPEP